MPIASLHAFFVSLMYVTNVFAIFQLFRRIWVEDRTRSRWASWDEGGTQEVSFAHTLLCMSRTLCANGFFDGFSLLNLCI